MPPSGLNQELTSLLNRYSQENASDTPDFILADFLLCCLGAWNASVQRREKWFGRKTPHILPLPDQTPVFAPYHPSNALETARRNLELIKAHAKEIGAITDLHTTHALTKFKPSSRHAEANALKSWKRILKEHRKNKRRAIAAAKRARRQGRG